MAISTDQSLPEYFNPTISTTLSGTIGSQFATAPGAYGNNYYQYGMNLNFLGAAMFPQVASTFNALQASLINVDASNPAQLLQIQLLMSEYENAVQSTSQMYASMQGVIKAIIQNI